MAGSPPSSAVASSTTHSRSSRRSSTSSNYDEEVLDPRVQVELEKLNHATDAINRLELELDEARGAFRQMLTESAVRLNALSKKLGSSIEKARPYYEARMNCKDAQMETQKAAIRFERANSMHVAAKEMVALAEQGLARQGRGGFDPAWQEMLNHSTMKVNEAEQERIASEGFHKLASHRYQEADQFVKFLQKDLKRNIAKSRSYFETKAKFNQVMEEQKSRVTKLEEQVFQTKKLYAESLQNLEQISDEIHRQREEQRLMRSLGSRESGVGAETPDPPHKVETPSPEHAVSRAPPAIDVNLASKVEQVTSPTKCFIAADVSKTSSTVIATTGTSTTPSATALAATTIATATTDAATTEAPQISLHSPESSDEEDDPELTSVDFSGIKDSLREIKESLSACTTPERGSSPIPQEANDDDDDINGSVAGDGTLSSQLASDKAQGFGAEKPTTWTIKSPKIDKDDDDNDDDVFKLPPTLPSKSQLPPMKDANRAKRLSVPVSPPKGRGATEGGGATMTSLGSEGNLSSLHLPRLTSSANSGGGFSVSSRSSSFSARLGIGRPLTTLSNASSVDDLDSETGSLASVEMLADQQIEMLMMDDQLQAMKRKEDGGRGSGGSGESGDGASIEGVKESGGGGGRRETELEQVLRSISLKHSVSLDKLKNIALSIKESSKKHVNLMDAADDES